MTTQVARFRRVIVGLVSLQILITNVAMAADATWTFSAGVRILNATSIELPVSDDTGTADVTAVKLPDGRIRAYFGVINMPSPGRVKSAVSSDGKTFVVEPGDRIPLEPSGQIMIGAASPFIYQLPDARFRLFMARGGGVSSATSSDGINFTMDAGLRLAQTAFQSAPTTRVQLFCSAIVALAESRYRMYCTQGVRQRQAQQALLVDRAIFSAVSSDLLNWTPEPGVRIGPGSAIPNDADHPTVLTSSPNGAVTLLYGRRLGAQDEWREWGEWIATSEDGLTFTKEAYTGVQGTEAAYVPTSGSSGILLYGNHTPATGSIISISDVRFGAAPSPSATPTAQATKTATKSIQPKSVTCVKGKQTKVFRGAAPKCPSGWQKR